MAQSTLETTIDDFYEKLDAKDDLALKKIAVAHQRTIDKLGTQLAIITAKIEDDISKGLDSGTYFLQQKRLAAFIQQADAEFANFGGQVGLALTTGQKEVVALAGPFVEDSIIGSNGPFPTGATFGVLPEGAIQEFVGTLGDGSPVRSLTETFGTEASKTLNNLLLTGISTGAYPLTIARDMASAIPAIGLSKANTIARTEMLRAMRGATTRHMVENKDILKGWRWYCALDKNTCPVCWAMHGKLHKVNERMATHPNCRCVQIPVTKSWKELGYDVPEPTLSKGMSQTGEELFSALDPTDQQFVLGKAGYTGWKNGLFKLDDFVQDTYSPDWGFGKTTRSISDMVGKGNVRALTQGKIPNGTILNPSKLELPPQFDPFDTAKKFTDDAFSNGKLSQADYDKVKDLIDTGSFTDPDQVEGLVTKIYEIEIKKADDLLIEVTQLDALPQAAIDDIVKALESGPNVDDLDELRQIMQEAIKTQKEIVKAEFDDAILELTFQTQKAQLYGSSNQTLIDAVNDNIANGFYKSKQEVKDAIDLISNEIKLNDPYAKLATKMDEASKLNPSLQSQANAINPQSLTIQEAKDQIAVWDDLVQQNTPLNHGTLTSHPKFSDLTKLKNDGKITQTEYVNLVQEGGNGLHTSKTFTEAVEQLETQAAKKVTKSSQQLLQELQGTGYTQSEKYALEQQYKSKLINKEQMQDYIDNAPAPKAPSSIGTVNNAPTPVGGNWNTAQEALQDAYTGYKNGTISYKDYNAIQKVYYNIGDVNPWGKIVDNDYFYKYVEKKLGLKPNATSVTKKGLPYKKHMQQLDDMLKQGAIDQTTYDDILLKFAQGKYKNKQVEQLINNFKIAGGQQGGSSYVAGSIDVKNFYWDYDGWMKSRGRAMNKLYQMTAAERDALREYTGSTYTQINRLLRKGSSGSYGDPQYIKSLIKEMDSYFNKSRLTEDVKIHRSFSVDATNPWANPKIGDVLTDKGFQSFTVRDGGLGGWGNTSDCSRSYVRIVAVAMKGSKAAWVQPISLHSSEEEMLIPRDAQFVVTDVKETKNHTPGCGSRWTIYGEFRP